MIPPVSRILQGLVAASPLERGRDEALHDVICQILDEIGADALVFRVGNNTLPLAVFRVSLMWQRESKTPFITEAVQLAAAKLSSGDLNRPFRDAITGREYHIVFPQAQLEATEVDPCFFCFAAGLSQDTAGSPRLKPQWRKLVTWNGDGGIIIDRDREEVESYCRALQLALLLRVERDSIFAPKVSETYWNLIDDLMDPALFARPWDDDGATNTRNVLTASLCFDLRKSTFALEKAIDRKSHSAWLETLVRVLRSLTQQRRGVFDKFTGDGVLAHFPVYAFERRNGPQAVKFAVENCVGCAWDMLAAANLCIDALQPNLSLRHKEFGAAVGVSFDDALWSIDTGGVPITVGRGVVEACRLSGGERGTVELTNAAYRRIEHLLDGAEQGEEIPFVSKDYPSGSGVTKFCMRRPPRALSTDYEAIRNAVGDAFADAAA